MVRIVKKPTIQIEAIYAANAASSCPRPLYAGQVPAGFPSPADDYVEGQLDLNRHLIRHPAATYFVRVTGDSMIEAGIHSGDLLIVDRSLEPKDKDVVIANVNGELTVKRVRLRKGQVQLVAENSRYPDRTIDTQTELEIWGVVKHVIHSL
ncbi:MAG: translesion error-prone DNA polymerase V autoproteolytic subunit [Sedimentisphaerales bacterium]|nr:translesion error-prone DNA polymerase V autoproteolytic subunit [Sedimentisphaerales bacterium]